MFMINALKIQNYLILPDMIKIVFIMMLVIRKTWVK